LKKLNKTDAITVENLEKPQSNETADLDGIEKQTSFRTRSFPRRCLSIEGATTTNHRTSSGLRPASIYLEMDYMKRSQSSKNRRTRSNYSVGERMTI